MKRIDIIRMMVALFILLLFSVLLGTGKIEKKALESLLFFCVIFCANRYGAGAGAVCGTLCGAVLALFSNNIADVGVVCIGGMMAGFFAVLGRAASCLGFIAPMAGISAFYSRQMLTNWQVLAGCLIYFLIPLSLLKEEKRIGKPLRRKETDIVCRQLVQMSESFKMLSNYFNDRNLMNKQAIAQAVKTSGASVEWIEKYNDSQKAIGAQFAQMGKMIQNTANQLKEVQIINSRQAKEITRNLKFHKIYAKRMTFFEYPSGRREVYMNVKSTKNHYVSAKEIVSCLNKETSRKWRMSSDCKNVINQTYADLVFEEEPRYQVFHGIARVTKFGEEVSGDSFSIKTLTNGRVLFCLSDGMGSGRKAYLESQMTLDLLEQLLETGFELEAATDFINHVLLFSRKDQHPTTLDICLLDLYTGEASLIKMGAPKSFLKRKNETQIIGNFQIPLGMIYERTYKACPMQFEDGDSYVMVTDGVLDQMNYRNGEEYFAGLIKKYSRINAKESALWLMNQVLSEDEDAKDDMTILIIGVHKR